MSRVTMQSERKGSTAKHWENAELTGATLAFPTDFMLLLFQTFYNVQNFICIKNVIQVVNVFLVALLTFVLFMILWDTTNFIWFDF